MNSSLRLVLILTVKSPVAAFSSPFIILLIVVPMLVESTRPINITISAVMTTVTAVMTAIWFASAII